MALVKQLNELNADLDKFQATGITAKTNNAILKKLISNQLTKDEEIDEIIEQLNELVPKINKSGDSIDKTFTYIRKIIKTVYGDEAYVKSRTALTHGDKAQKIKTQKQKLMVANNNITKVSKSHILEIIARIIASEYLSDAIILAMISSGSRLIEILKISKFTKSDIADHIAVEDVAKQKNTKNLVKPLLFIPVDQFLVLIKNIRFTLKNDLNLPNDDLTNKYQQTINYSVKKYFDGLKSHGLRKIYGAYSYRMRPSTNKASFSGWLNKNLGHDSLDTSLYYTNIEITD